MNIFIHRRDLRINDNTSLINLEEDIIPIFIFDPLQIDKNKNEYFSNNLVYFMCESLIELKNEYKKLNGNLQFFYGNYIKIIKDLIKKNEINSISFNLDYSPYSKKRDKEIADFCNANNIKCNVYEDMLLNSIDSGKSLIPSTKKPYTVFTPFMNNLKKYKVEKPKKNNSKYNDFLLKSKYIIEHENLAKFYNINKNLHIKPGRKEGIIMLNKIKNQKKYDELRNNLNYSTTNLSAYINLGLISIREVYYKIIEELGINNGLINELYWREFYYNILNYFPHVVGNSFKEKFDKIKWNNNAKFFELWCIGKTGFPIVDACMRQMNISGYMHNRGRMIVSSFLVKDLQIDWKLGEKYFANNLIDYNISANNGGWQWSAGTGTDSQPYFRIFNPWTQSKNFDPDCKYIKKWIDELKNVENKKIHEWFKYYSQENTEYPQPIVDHSEQRKITLEMYKSL